MTCVHIYLYVNKLLFILKAVWEYFNLTHATLYLCLCLCLSFTKVILKDRFGFFSQAGFMEPQRSQGVL